MSEIEGLAATSLCFACIGPFRVAADYSLPFPVLEVPASEFTVNITAGDVPETLGKGAIVDSDAESMPGLFLLRLPSGGRILVESGRHIRYFKAPATSQDELNHYVFGSAWTALCYMRGILVLHASAVHVNTGDGGSQLAVVSGNSGAGKSSIAAAMLARGGQLHADDTLMVGWRVGQPIVYGWQGRLRLWGDSCDVLALDNPEPMFPGSPKAKYQLSRSQYTSPFAPLKALYLLSWSKPDDAFRINLRENAAALGGLWAALHFPGMANFYMGSDGLMRALLALEKKVKVYEYFRPRDMALLTESARRLESHLLADNGESLG